MNGIRNIRVVQTKRKCSGYVRGQGLDAVFKEWTEMVSWKLQKTVDTSEGIQWVDIDVIEEWEDA